MFRRKLTIPQQIALTTRLRLGQTQWAWGRLSFFIKNPKSKEKLIRRMEERSRKGERGFIGYVLLYEAYMTGDIPPEIRMMIGQHPELKLKNHGGTIKIKKV